MDLLTFLFYIFNLILPSVNCFLKRFVACASEFWNVTYIVAARNHTDNLYCL